MEDQEKIELEYKIKALYKFVQENKLQKVQELISTISPQELAENITKWNNETLIDLFEILNPEVGSKILYNLQYKKISILIQNFSLNDLKKLFNELYIDEIVDILEHQNTFIQNKVFSILTQEEIKKIKSYSKYDKNSVGYNMSIDYIKISDDIDAKTAIKSIKNQVANNDSEITGYIFVVDKTNNLVGLVKSEILITANSNEMISNIMEETPWIRSTDSLKVAKNTISKYEQSFIPVLNHKDKLVGVIGAEDFLQLAEFDQIVFEDNSSSKIKPYSKQSSFDLFKNRVFWIIALLIIGSITQIMIIGFQLIWQANDIWSYNDSVSGSVVVSSIITLGLTTSLSVASSINDASGNSGAQSSSTIIRAIATEDIDESMYKKVIFKEFVAGIYIGFTAAFTAIVRMWVIWAIMGQLGGSTSYELLWYFIISFIAAISFFFAIIVGNVFGALLPIIAAKKDKDGALFSGPLQTTVVDIITFLIYLSITTLVFVLAKESINSHDPNIETQIVSTLMQTLSF